MERGLNQSYRVELGTRGVATKLSDYIRFILKGPKNFRASPGPSTPNVYGSKRQSRTNLIWMDSWGSIMPQFSYTLVVTSLGVVARPPCAKQ